MRSDLSGYVSYDEHRLSKRHDGVNYELGNGYYISSWKKSFFTLVHLINRSVINVSLVFWIQNIITCVQLLICPFLPYNINCWPDNHQSIGLIKTLRVLLRIIPFESSEIIHNYLFFLYFFISLAHFLILFVLSSMLNRKKHVSTLMSIYFYWSYLLMPLFRTSIASLFAYGTKQFFINSSFSMLLYSLIGITGLFLHIINVSLCAFIMGSSPSPNMSNPTAVWCTLAYRAILFDLLLIVTVIVQELSNEMSKTVFLWISIIFIVFLAIPGVVYFLRVPYFISFVAFEYISGILVSLIVFCLIIVYCLYRNIELPSFFYLTISLLLPIICAFVIKSYINSWINKMIKQLDECESHLKNFGDDHNPSDVNLMTYDQLSIYNESQGVNLARIACYFSHPSFRNMSLVTHLASNYPNDMFHYLHLSSLLPNNSAYVQNMLVNFLENRKLSFLEEIVVFQIQSIVSESANEMTQEMLREVSLQSLQSMKCKQILNKVWTSCFKGDIGQMSKYSFSLYTQVSTLSKKWEFLVLRYPFSKPVLKEYATFLMGIGCQHRKSLMIQALHPNLIENNGIGIESEVSLPSLQRAIEEAVDRRPISTLRNLRTLLVVSIIGVLIFLIGATVFCLYVTDNFESADLFVYQGGHCCELISYIPNLFDVIRMNNTICRNYMYQISKNLSDSMNIVLDSIEQSVLSSVSNYSVDVYFELGNYSRFHNGSMMDSLNLVQYFSNTLSYIPSDDAIFSSLINNIVNTLDILDLGISIQINNTKAFLSRIHSIIPIIITSLWVVIIAFLLPSIIIVVDNLKDEMKYLFSLYFSIPRSMIVRIIENNGQVKQNERPSITRLMTSSFAHKGRSFGDDEEQYDNEKAPHRVADSFRAVTGDHDTKHSVLPKHFILKASIVFFVLNGITSILTTIALIFLYNNTTEIVKCLNTIQLINQRSTYASLVMHGITSDCHDYGYDFIVDSIAKMTTIHSSLLFSSSSNDLSTSMQNSDAFIKLHFVNRCNSSTNISCKSIVSLYDLFINTVVNASGYIQVNGSIDSSFLRGLYINELFPMFSELGNQMFLFLSSYSNSGKRVYIILSITGVFFLVFTLFVGGLPLLQDLDGTAGSVKLPLKYVQPFELCELNTMIQYLQGECDYYDRNVQKDDVASSIGIPFLNAIMYPFSVYEFDTTLLFANNAFYSLLSTSRESAVGLPLSAIFSSVLTYKKNPNHPFHQFLDTVLLMQKGSSENNFFEIYTEMEISGRTSFPVLLRLVYTSNIQIEDSGNTVQRKYFIVFISDLSWRKSLEDKLKYESDISSKLMDSAVSRPLSIMLKSTSGFTHLSYTDKPLLLINIKCIDLEDSDDFILMAISTFLRSTSNLLNQYTSIIRIVHNPPYWIFASGLSQNSDDLQFSMSELIHFGIGAIDEFIQACHYNDISISALMHVGSFTIIPITHDLPNIELLGPTHSFLKTNIHLVPPGVLASSPSATENFKAADFIIRPLSDTLVQYQKSIETNPDL